ncbi:MAG: tolB protein [Polyangiaceae bacterium]
MRLTPSLSTCAFALFFSGAALAGPNANAPLGASGHEGRTDAPPPEDLLGTMVIEAGAARSLPKIGVVPSLSADTEDVALRAVVRRDLDLCGEFELLAESAAPDGLYLADSPVDTKAWANKGAEAVVRVSASKSGDRVELTGQAFLTSVGATPVLEKKMTVLGADLRAASHRLADSLIGALTGTNGGFASRLTFASGTGKVRRVYVIDADGAGARAVSPEDETALAPAFGAGNEVYYASSKGVGEYRIHTESGKDQALSTRGSVYGIAFDASRTKVAVSLGSGGSIRLLSGPDLAHLTPATSVPFAMEPTFSPTGKLTFAGMDGAHQRVYVDGKPVTPGGTFSMSPTFCKHPDGTRLVFAAGAAGQTDLYSTGETGGTTVRLTQNHGSNSSPACSPDGRLVAFFSTRTGGEGPGLYVMRADGLRPKRISPLLGDSLRWEALPAPPDPAPAPAPTASAAE